MSHHNEWPKRFGKHIVVDGGPREIGELSERARKRLETREKREREAQPPALQTQNVRYAELHCLSNFTFQRGASHAEELFNRAKKLGYKALAITDECSLAGIVRARLGSEATDIPLIVGTEVRFEDGIKLVILAKNRDGYSDICKLITTGRRSSPKGEYKLSRTDAEKLGTGVFVLWAPGPLARWVQADLHDAAKWMTEHFGDRARLAVELHRGADDKNELKHLQELGASFGLKLVAAGDVHMHSRNRRALQDVMTAIRLRRTVAEAGDALFPNGERHLRDLRSLTEIYPIDLIEETIKIAEACEFHLKELKYQYPHEIVPAGMEPHEYLRKLAYEGAATRIPQGVTPKVKAMLEKELGVIQRKKYEAFFLTVYGIVKWAREQDPPILCQGRGSSANSAVCFCLGITAVNPEEGHLLFERFLSDERDEPPDIDVDFEHERREEVIQHVFKKYGRHRTALAATVISYRGRSAFRDVGRALGLPDDALDQLASMHTHVPSDQTMKQAMRDRGFDPDSLLMMQLAQLVSQLGKMPRHLSQHVGGFVISEEPLHHLVPIENAAMPERTIIQWDKDDLETMELLKVDCLALGMLTCIRKCVDLLHKHHLWKLPCIGAAPGFIDIPQDKPGLKEEERKQFLPVYDMICAADTIGVFQIESRAQMSMLPRLRPERFYDLVIEVAIVRPGPIQGNMVHPYLRRRKKPEEVDYPKSKFERDNAIENSKVKDVLERTLGVPIFQEQVMELLQVTADFTPDEANQLRRSMAAWKRKGGLEKFERRVFDGLKKNGYDETFAKQIWEQIQGFGEYGFPESHSYSFALLAWASSWLKCHFPAAFTCALLNSQPMGFYQPSQLIQDAQRHGVIVRPIDVTISTWDCALEKTSDAGKPELRLGLRLLKGMSEELARRLDDSRQEKPFADVADMTRRARVTSKERAWLADSGALRSLSKHRHHARWDSAGAELPLPILARTAIAEKDITFRPPSLRAEVMNDYATQGLSLTLHPLALIRPQLKRMDVISAAAALGHHGEQIHCAGLVTVRQHPGTAKGVIFVTLEDETGQVNVVVWSRIASSQHRVLMESRVMGVRGRFESHEGVHHLIADRLFDYSSFLPEIHFESRDFH